MGDPQDWKQAPAYNLESAIATFKALLPGWWFSVCECQVSCDASCAPTRESQHIALIGTDPRFDQGFHVDLPQPSTLAQALLAVLDDAQSVINGEPPTDHPKMEARDG